MRSRCIALAFVSVVSWVTARVAAQETVRVTYHDPTRAWAGLNTEIRGLRVSGGAANTRFRVFETNGRIVGAWPPPLAGREFGPLCKPLAAGRFLAMLNDAAGGGGILAEIDGAGAVRWALDPMRWGLRLHHDFQRLRGGNTLVLTDTVRKAPWPMGGPIYDDVIVEVNRAGEMVWAWSTVDHAAQLPFTPAEWQYLRQQQTTLLFHTNSIQALPPNRWEQDDFRFRRGNVLVSQRNTNLVFLIDKLTGDIVWSYRGAIGQHHPRMIPGELPGAGNILIYDNGGLAGLPPVSRAYTRIVELDPIRQREVWTYVCGESTGVPCSAGSVRIFRAPFMGSAQRLPNGNTLISDLPAGRVFEVTAEGQLVWEYLINSGEQIYRAYRLPLDWRERETFDFYW